MAWCEFYVRLCASMCIKVMNILNILYIYKIVVFTARCLLKKKKSLIYNVHASRVPTIK